MSRIRAVRALPPHKQRIAGTVAKLNSMSEGKPSLLGGLCLFEGVSNALVSDTVWLGNSICNFQKRFGWKFLAPKRKLTNNYAKRQGRCAIYNDLND